MRSPEAPKMTMRRGLWAFVASERLFGHDFLLVAKTGPAAKPNSGYFRELLHPGRFAAAPQ